MHNRESCKVSKYRGQFAGVVRLIPPKPEQGVNHTIILHTLGNQREAKCFLNQSSIHVRVVLQALLFFFFF